MQLSSVRPYAVVENAGQDNERIIKRFDQYDDAYSYVQDHYREEEIDNLIVDIIGVYDDGTLTTEI